MTMSYHIHLTVNSKSREYDYTFEQTDSLDAIMIRALQMHPSATSVVMSIAPNVDGMGATFPNAELDPDRLREDRDDHMRDA